MIARLDVNPSRHLPSRERRLPVETLQMLEVRTGQILYIIIR